MSIKAESISQDLITAIKCCDPIHVRNVLDSSQFSYSSLKEAEDVLIHLICNDFDNEITEDNKCSAFFNKRRDIIYMLIDAGIDIDCTDENGNSCLFHAVRNDDTFTSDILLQCGADMWINTEFDVSIYDYVCENSTIDMKTIFQNFFPGVWKAVESEDIYELRKLVNLWCRTDLVKDNVSLKDLALATGNEEIISLILGIFDSMKLVYHINAKNISAVSNLLETKRHRVRLDLRKMSDRGAPILYYLIQSGDSASIELLVKHGCQLYTLMQDPDGRDMPVFYSALKSETPVDVFEALLPSGKANQEEMLYKILYKGQTVLEVALKENVSLDVFDVLIDRGGPQLVCERNQANQTVSDLAILSGKKQYADIIDENVLSWILYPYKYPGRRQKLAMLGWNLAVVEEEVKENLYIDDYFVRCKPLQETMERMAEAVERGDLSSFLELRTALGEEDNFLWYGRVVGDGMPLLHRTVLYNCPKMAEIILEAKPSKESVDNLFDQNRRTALHYACALTSTRAIETLLGSYGCSEHVLDKVNREPLDFRDKRDTPEMLELLQRLKSKEFQSPEGDPWCEGAENLCCEEPTQQHSECDSDCSSQSEHRNTSSCSIM